MFKNWINIKQSKTNVFFHFIKDWSTTITAIAMVTSILYVVYSTNKNMQMISQTIEHSKETLLLQKKSIPAQFEMTYRNVNTYNEQAFITNTGKTLLLNVAADYKYYFIYPDGKVLTGTSIKNKVKKDTLLFNEIRQSGLIKHPTDFIGLFGTSRNFYLSQLEPKKETLLEISSSSIQNALKLARVLKSKVFTRWRIKYNEELSNKEVIVRIYIWINEANTDKYSMVHYGLREDLKRVLGGTNVIELIEYFENNSKEVIFGNE